MFDGNYIVLCVTLITLVLMILSAAWFVNSLIILIRLKHQERDYNEIRKELEEENSKVSTEYSEKLLEFVKMLTSQISILQFRTFIDGHDMDKVTRAQIQELAKSIAVTVNKSINIDNIDFDSALFTKEFYEGYIIENALINVKTLLQKAINEEE